MLKRLLSATLALTLLGGSAAVAAPYGHGNRGHHNGYNNGYSQQYNGNRYDDRYDRGNRYDRDYRYRRHYRHHDDGAAVAAVLGFAALAAIVASQDNHRHHDRRYNDGY